MGGSQEDIGEMFVNLGASRMSSVSIYFEKTRTYASLFFFLTRFAIYLVFAFRDGDALLSG